MKLTESNPYGLTDKQLLFCKNYIGITGDCRFNGTESAIKAGYSKNTARTIASENLTKPNIVQHLDLLSQQLKNTSEKTPADAIKELEMIAFSNPLTYLDVQTGWINTGEVGEDGNPILELKQLITLKDSKDWGNGAAIQEISQNKDGTIKIKLHNKASALDSFLQIHDIFPAKKTKSEITGKDGEPLAAIPAQYVFFLPKDLPELVPPNQQPKVNPQQEPVSKELKEMRDKVSKPGKEVPKPIDMKKVQTESILSIINKNKHNKKG